ncbi:hypothetical protein E2L08_06780 [Palleronia sediminis]|uniref:Cyclic-phosphate processing Receiver domain-containing protein n=1 Tax=Palleronia sediminis TaxID=2547833 RepID=A0A4R6AE08_9RHOB|nr:cyclic-phosphate processing receiver domain-containing protein [Palleronia sediminis]TDL81365.1 hypothetical protein E2L08_06780 [Palleronia sediminis]
MTYALFIDDERDPPADGKLWRIARSLPELRAMLDRHGPPHHASFDHDLGEGMETGLDIAKFMVEQDLEYRAGERATPLPVGFSFYVHSQNPVGAENIRSYLGNYLAVRNGLA